MNNRHLITRFWWTLPLTLLLAIVLWKQVELRRAQKENAQVQAEPSAGERMAALRQQAMAAKEMYGTPQAVPGQVGVPARLAGRRPASRPPARPGSQGKQPPLSKALAERMETLQQKAGANLTPPMPQDRTDKPARENTSEELPLPEGIELPASAQEMGTARIEEMLKYLGVEDYELAEQLRAVLGGEDRTRRHTIRRAKEGAIAIAQMRTTLSRLRDEFDPDIQDLVSPEQYRRYLELRRSWSEIQPQSQDEAP